MWMTHSNVKLDAAAHLSDVWKLNVPTIHKYLVWSDIISRYLRNNRIETQKLLRLIKILIMNNDASYDGMRELKM